jgi:undecaprenyl-diphosphatase
VSILDTLQQWDRDLFLYLNGMGSEQWDAFWLGLTNKFTWIPLYVLLLYGLFTFFPWKKALLYLLLVALLVAFTDQFVNLIKYTTGRLRPCNDPFFQDIARIIKHSGGYSFFSGHATNSMAVSMFMILLLRKYTAYVWGILIWPLSFAYSRIYLGVHYPGDVLTGLMAGILIGLFFYKISGLIIRK